MVKTLQEGGTRLLRRDSNRGGCHLRSICSFMNERTEKFSKFGDWLLCETHLSDIFEVVVSFLQGPGSVKGLPHARVLAEERLAVVLDPVYHLEGRKPQALVKCAEDQSSSPPLHPLFFFYRSTLQKVSGLMN